MSAERLKVLAALQASYNIDKINDVSALAVGDATADIKEVQGYLKHFGYIKASYTYAEGTLDQTTSAALGAFQAYQNIDKTGVLDGKTKTVISLSRCGFPDVLDSLAFSVTPQGWNRRNLTYTLGNIVTQGVTTDVVRAAIQRGFAVWANTGLGLTFTEIASNQNPDIFVEWRPAQDPDHSMVGNILAHADIPLRNSITN